MSKTSTQQFLEIDQIKEGVVILKDKTLRGILMVSSLNFALKSEEEQKAIIYQFQSFLNSLDFTCQIVIQSRRLNITGYIEKLKELENKQSNKLLKIQTTDYRKFIEDLIKGIPPAGKWGQIINKNFFVIIPFVSPITITEEKFKEAKAQLTQRIEFITMGLRRCGLQCTPLNTSELIELFWSLYHLEQAEQGYYPTIPPELTDDPKP